MKTFEHPLDIQTFMDQLSYQFKDIDLLYSALTHRSFDNENLKSNGHNERMEFLGDAVVGLIVTEYLFNTYTQYDEGELSSLRAQLICKETLAKISRKLDIGKYILLGKGEINSGGQNRDSLLSDTFEAVIAAIFIDGGIDMVREVILQHFVELLNQTFNQKPLKEYKNLLQEYTQFHFQSSPNYVPVSAIGPDHAKWYEVEVRINDDVHGRGRGPSKKEAEKNAAKEACEILNIIN